MEIAKFIAKTLENQQIFLTEQMVIIAEQFKDAGKQIKSEDKEEFFKLTSNVFKKFQKLIFILKKLSQIKWTLIMLLLK